MVLTWLWELLWIGLFQTYQCEKRLKQIKNENHVKVDEKKKVLISSNQAKFLGSIEESKIVFLMKFYF